MPTFLEDHTQYQTNIRAHQSICVIIAIVRSDSELMSLSTLFSILANHPNLANGLTLSSFFQFFRLIRHLKENLSWHRSPDIQGPPLILPKKIRSFCATALSIKDQRLILECWETLRDMAWGMTETDKSQRAGDLVNLFLKHGVEFGISMFLHLQVIHFLFSVGFHDLYSPIQRCLDPHCLGGHNGLEPQELLNLCGYRTVLFKRNHGPLPTWLYSVKCYCEWSNSCVVLMLF